MSTFSAADSLARQYGLADSIQIRFRYNVPFSDSLVLSDIPSLNLSLFLLVGDALVLSDSAAGAGTLNFSLTDSLVLADRVSLESGGGFELSELLSLSDSLDSGLGHAGTAADNFVWADSVTIVVAGSGVALPIQLLVQGLRGLL